jgi:HSP20 family protein
MALPVRRRNSDTTPQRRWTSRPLWDPFGELENLWGEMGRLLDWMPSPGDSRNWVPLAEQEETEDAYLVRAELPGVPQDKVSVDIEDDQLAISGELDQQELGEGNRVLSRRTGRFAYRTSLPRGVNTEAVTADLKDGILTVRVPKSGEAKRRHIEIAGRSV